MEKCIRISQEIYKYLKFMKNIESCSDHTLRAYALDLEQIFDFSKFYSIAIPSLEKTAGPVAAEPGLNEKQILAAARAAFTRWRNLGAATRHRKTATLKSFLGWLYKDGLIESNLSAQFVCTKRPRKLPNFLSVDEILAVMKSFDDDEHSAQLERERAMFLLLYGGGLRVSEACGLRWKDVLWGQSCLRVLGKGNKERLIILPGVSVTQLKSIKHSGIYVFGEEPLNTRVAYEWIRRRGAKAQLHKPLHPHVLRHSYATHLLTSGANLRTLQELLGHSSLQATEKYTHIGISQLANMMDERHPLGLRAQGPRLKKAR